VLNYYSCRKTPFDTTYRENLQGIGVFSVMVTLHLY